ncbi:MAG: type VI secretion system baseplate subunit TssG [Phycisphaerales bacterium]|nr:type VI secretion system baseplate subunit TssG [Phycisphaerales bacterium]
MASESPRTPPDAVPVTLLERLEAEAPRFDFFQAVWLLERLVGGLPVGERGPVADERIRFRPDLSLGFPASDVRRILAQRDSTRGTTSYTLEETFLGLYGVSTPLPLHYAVDILRGADAGSIEEGANAADENSPVRAFLDVLHHRVIALFYRAGLKYRFERTFPLAGRDVLSSYLRLLIGLPPGSGAGQLGVPPIRLLRYCGTLTQHPRSAATLAGLLSDYWGGLPFRVTQFVGEWVALDSADQNRCGGMNCTLGEDLTIGEQVYDLGSAFAITVGPVDWETYLTFVPGGPRFRQTRALIKLYCMDPLAFTLEVELAEGVVPETRLTSEDDAGALGLTTWVSSVPLGATAATFAATEETEVRIGLMLS